MPRLFFFVIKQIKNKSFVFLSKNRILYIIYINFIVCVDIRTFLYVRVKIFILVYLNNLHENVVLKYG